MGIMPRPQQMLLTGAASDSGGFCDRGPKDLLFLHVLVAWVLLGLERILLRCVVLVSADPSMRLGALSR